ncbi:MAG: O-antigen ligase family protein, partial [Candidatus Hydrogenedentes bacterium]|nr:O-antigen ligase family protein [Candidatus Hydrogenedentota bacterium]
MSRTYLVVFVGFASISAYTAIAVAPSVKMASYATGTSIAAILAGLAASALLRRYGDGIIMRVSWALFLAMLLHAPFWIWLYVTEGQNPDFDWNNRTPGYPSVRMYGYSVEAGLAAALGLFYLSDNKSKLLRTGLIVGTALLWMLLFWSGGRGAFFALLATSVVVALITPKFATKMWKFLVATIAIGAGLSLLLPVPSSAYGLLRRFNGTGNTASLNDLSSDRLTLWSDAYSIFLDRPIFGHGMLQYSHVTTLTRVDAPIQVHNIVLESLIAFGLVGTIALVFLLGKIWVSAAIRLRRGDSLSTLPVFLVASSLPVHWLGSG